MPGFQYRPARTRLKPGMARLRLEGLSGHLITGLYLLSLLIISCQTNATLPQPPDSKPTPLAPTTQELVFQSSDGTRLAGQFDWPPAQTRPPLVFIIHHADAIDRYQYQFLVDRLLPAGYAVFRFDKRGTGRSSGVYGCCEDDDALAAYRAAMTQGGFDPEHVFIVAQSIGTTILANHFEEFAQIHPPTGVVLLSSLLEYEEVLAVKTPIHIIVSDSEPNLSAIGVGAVQAHQAAYAYGASFYVAPQTEHTLFDISHGPIDWSAPDWPEKFHSGAWTSLLSWLETHQKS